MTPLLRLGHRGARARKSIPENSIASFDQALAEGCDGFEFDVRLTADGQPVICHDPTIGALEIQKTKAADVGRLCTLPQVLQRYHERAFLDIELKVAGLEEITIGLLHQYPVKRGVVVSSFLPEVLERLRELDISIPLGLIAETKSQLKQWTEVPVEYMIPQHALLTASLAEQLKSKRKKVLAWTVNRPADIKRLASYRIDGLISDDPALLCKTLSE